MILRLFCLDVSCRSYKSSHFNWFLQCVLILCYYHTVLRIDCLQHVSIISYHFICNCAKSVAWFSTVVFGYNLSYYFFCLCFVLNYAVVYFVSFRFKLFHISHSGVFYDWIKGIWYTYYWFNYVDLKLIKFCLMFVWLAIIPRLLILYYTFFI